jgi:BirA family biotin operon repressor/biotin-[acetyl-CoA-carboxylase] ligase
MYDLSFRVLRLLADGEFHSGAAIARALGVSRGTVWNAVHALEDAGVTVYKVHGRGYKLAEAISLLDPRAVERGLGALAARYTLEVVDVAESTNTLLMQGAAAGARDGTVIACEWQRAGRGRMGRAWHAGIGGALTFSVLWRAKQAAAGLGGLSLAVGLALVRAFSALGARETQLKWPNDVLWRGAKLAGILVEMQGDALGPSAIVIGIGVNVRLSSDVRTLIDQAATDLESACGGKLERSAVLAAILANLARVLDTFSEAGFAPLRREWERAHIHQSRPVVISLPTGAVENGVAQGVADDGALLFRTGTVIRRLHSGEVSLREQPARARAAKPV